MGEEEREMNRKYVLEEEKTATFSRNKRTNKCQARIIFTDLQDKSGRLTTLKK